MKKILMLASLLLVCEVIAYAQEPEAAQPKPAEPKLADFEVAEPKATISETVIGEPEFIGEVFVLYPDGSAFQLEKTTVQFTAKLSASAYIVGIGKARTRITVPGPSAETRIPSSDEFQFIIKAVDNNSDPLSIVDIFRFDVTKKQRQAELESTSTFGGGKSNNLDFLPFTAKKYGTSSYLITLKEKPAGEFGIIVRNPNALDERSTVVSSFAIVQ